MKLKIQKTVNPTVDTQDFLWAKLREYSLGKLNLPDHETNEFFTLEVKEGGNLIAGAICYFYFKGLNLQLLWVDEGHRGKKIGEQLLAHIEEEAHNLKARLIFLYSFSFQAPKFYLKYGYKQVGIIEDFPEGHDCYFLSKKLAIS
jgi:GNAT superfamily N-acetyltransferase